MNFFRQSAHTAELRHRKILIIPREKMGRTENWNILHQKKHIYFNAINSLCLFLESASSGIYIFFILANVDYNFFLPMSSICIGIQREHTQKSINNHERKHDFRRFSLLFLFLRFCLFTSICIVDCVNFNVEFWLRNKKYMYFWYKQKTRLFLCLFFPASHRYFRKAILFTVGARRATNSKERIYQEYFQNARRARWRKVSVAQRSAQAHFHKAILWLFDGDIPTNECRRNRGNGVT